MQVKTNTNAVSSVNVNDNINNSNGNKYSDIIYSSSDDNTGSIEATNTAAENRKINKTTHADITKQQKRQARFEA